MNESSGTVVEQEPATTPQAVTLEDLQARARRSEEMRSRTPRTASLETVRVGLNALPETECESCGRKYQPVELRGHVSGCPTCSSRVSAATQATAITAAPGQAPRIDVATALSEAGVNMHKYRSASLDTFDGAEDPEAAAAAWRYVHLWRATHGEGFAYRPWMYLFGGGSEMIEEVRTGRSGQYTVKDAQIGRTGNGKTHLAIAVARQLVEEGLLQPERLMFAEMEEILMKSEATIRGADDSEDRLVRHYSAPDLLIIDDAFVRPPTNHSMRLLMRILNRRAGRGLILTSNISPKTAMEWDHGMRRIVDRILDDCGEGGEFIVRFNGRSRRSDRIRARAA